MMPRVLVDIGNSRLKYALVNGAVHEPASLPCDDKLRDRLATYWQDLPVPATLTVSSVAESRILEEVAHVAESLAWPRLRLARVQRLYKGLRVGYDDLNGLGVDRWLAMLGARACCTGAFVVIDVGTAVTLDAVDARGVHQGGGIVPGLSALRGALPPVSRHSRYAESERVVFPATNTGDGIHAGTLLGLADLINGLTERLVRAIEAPEPTIFLTGGDATAVLPYLTRLAHYRRALVLEGLAQLGETEMVTP